MTINEMIQNINQAVNYPALAYSDISLYFDMAIAELNTTLHTSIPTVSQMISEYEQRMSKVKNKSIRLDKDPEVVNYDIPSFDTSANAATAKTLGYRFYFVFETHKFYVLNRVTNTYYACDKLDGFYVKEDADTKYYTSCIIGDEVFWIKSTIDNILECDLADYLPDEWALLWMIPYICYKYTCRDGGTAATFAEEMTQGFQQLQETYDVPATVCLATYADRVAYTKLVEQNLPNLNIKVPTRAIYQDMKHNRVSNAIFGGMYDRGGFDD